MVRLRKEPWDIVQHIWKELPLLLPPEKGPWQLLLLPQGVICNQAHLLLCVLIAQGRVCGPWCPS